MRFGPDAIVYLNLANKGQDIGHIRKANITLRRHVSKRPVVLRYTLGNGAVESLVGMVSWVIDGMDQRGPGI